MTSAGRGNHHGRTEHATGHRAMMVRGPSGPDSGKTPPSAGPHTGGIPTTASRPATGRPVLHPDARDRTRRRRRLRQPGLYRLLGYRDGARLTGRSLPELLVAHSDTAPEDCVALLRAPNGVVKWRHTEEYPVSTVVSNTILHRETDPLLMVSLTDITAWVWAGASDATRRQRAR